MPPVPDSSPASGADGGGEDRLRRLEAITDLDLAQLEFDALLPELLDRVRDLLGVDTAAVLLVDESGEFLLATAARGLEEEVLQGSRVPLGLGFAGMVASRRRPVTVPDVTPASVVNPVLLRKGVRSMLGVPLLDGDDVLGVLHVGTLRPRDFTAFDIELLEQAADRAAAALITAQSRLHASAARVLQRSLAPAAIPRVPGVQVAVRYVPGDTLGVGGDWYDVFALPSGHIAVVVGDVMGHGLEAAAAMGRIRSALRACSLEDEDPAVVLSRLDTVVQTFEQERLATVVYACYDAATGQALISSAGHPPPLLGTPEDARVLAVPPDTPLGVGLGGTRRVTEVEVPPGAALMLYTDGLIERRGNEIDAAIQHLRRLLAADGEATAEQICADVMAELIGDRAAPDDVALLVLRREPRP